MPKRSNPKKMAAQQFGKMRSLASAANDGKYLVAKVEKPLGNCQFHAQLDLGGRRLQQAGEPRRRVRVCLELLRLSRA